MPLSFVDGACRIRDVPAGITYEFSLFGPDSSVTAADNAPLQSNSIAAQSSLTGLLNTALVVDITATVHRIDHHYNQTTGYIAALHHSGGAIVNVDTDPDPDGKLMSYSIPRMRREENANCSV